MDKDEDQSYSISVRLLGNEVFALTLTTTSTRNRWVAVAMISMFSILILLGAYGDKLVNFYSGLTG